MNTAVDRTVVRSKDFRAGDVGKHVSNAFGAIADQLSQGMQEWSSKAKAAAKSTNGLVRSSPWQAVGAVALVALAAGMLVARRTRRSQGIVDASSELSGG